MRTLKTLLMVCLAMGLWVTTAVADGYEADDGFSFYDRAKVVKVKPIYHLVQISQPRKQCWNEESVESGDHYTSATGTIIGGIVGGVVGSHIGAGDGRKIATVAGTILGASVGHDISRNSRRQHQGQRIHRERRCHVRHSYHEEERFMGYRVHYRYHGKVYQTNMNEDPGRWLRIRVAVTPVGDY